MGRVWIRAAAWVLSACLILVLCCLGGCATYSAKFVDLRPALIEQDYDTALTTIEEKCGSKDRLLYFLERGLVLHFADRWVESNEAFAAAERTAEDLYTKSVSEGVFSLFSNDNAISYRARPFEMAQVPYYKALNYLYLGQREEALVEARRASLLLSKYIDATLDGLREEDRDDLAMTRNNAFLLYFSGMLYDREGDVNDAFIAYRNAAVAYQQNSGLLDLEIPPSLALDLERVGRYLGFDEELEQARMACPGVYAAAGLTVDSTTPDLMPDMRWKPGHGEVALFLEMEFVPQKTQIRFDIPVFDGEAYDDPDYWAWEIQAGMGNMQAFASGHEIEYWISVAAPELQDRTPGISRARVSAGVGGAHYLTVQVENLGRAARITFDAEKPAIFFKTILRGLTKYLATRGAEEAGGKLAGFLANLFGAATESADTRSWLTLPDSIHLARFTLPPGTYDFTVEVLDGAGHSLGIQTVPGVLVRAGDWTMVSRRVF